MTIRIHSLGHFEISVGGEPLRFTKGFPRKPLELMFALLAAGERGLAQHKLCEVLWAQSEGDAAYRSLITTVYRLRNLLHCHEAVIFSAGVVALSPACCWIDAWEFERSLSELAESATRDRALATYRGPLLVDVDCPLVFEARERLRRKYVSAVLHRAQSLERAGSWATAVEVYERAVDADNGNEDLHRALIRCLGQLGRTTAVMHAYQRCKASLLRQFGIRPSAITERLYREARGAHSTADIRRFPVAASAATL
jgi:DNA-binding SARP family transcriptional activator